MIKKLSFLNVTSLWKHWWYKIYSCFQNISIQLTYSLFKYKHLSSFLWLRGVNFFHIYLKAKQYIFEVESLKGYFNPNSLAVSKKNTLPVVYHHIEDNIFSSLNLIVGPGKERNPIKESLESSAFNVLERNSRVSLQNIFYSIYC